MPLNLQRSQVLPLITSRPTRPDCMNDVNDSQFKTLQTYQIHCSDLLEERHGGLGDAHHLRDLVLDHLQ